MITVLATQAPDLGQALDRAMAEGLPPVVLDGTLIRTGRCHEKTESVRGTFVDLWYCGKIRAALTLTHYEHGYLDESH